MIFDAQLRTKFSKGAVVKLLSVIGDKYFGNPVPADDIGVNALLVPIFWLFFILVPTF